MKNKTSVPAKKFLKIPSFIITILARTVLFVLAFLAGFVVLLFILSVIYYSLGIVILYDQRPQNPITFASTSSPVFPIQSIGFENFTVFTDHNGSIRLDDHTRKPLTFYDSNGVKLLEVIPNIDPKQNLEYKITNHDTNYIKTGKVFDNYALQLAYPDDWVHYPDIKITLFNHDGSTLTGPYQDQILYDKFSYKNGLWKRYPLLDPLNAPENLQKLDFDYFFEVEQVFTQIKPNPPQTQFALGITDHLQYLNPAKKLGFAEEVYPWSLKIDYEGTIYNQNFLTFKNPPNLILIPIGLPKPWFEPK